MKKLIGMLIFAMTAEVHAGQIPNQTNFAFLDLLVWQFNEAGSENWGQNIERPGRYQSGTILTVPFHWSTGVRAGVGHVFGDNDFDVALAYTHYQTSATDQTAGVVYSPFDGNYFANNTNGPQFGPSYRSANINWRVFYNTLDLELGRQFHPSPIITLHPFLGIKGASINQKIYTNWLNPYTYTNFTAASENLKNDFNGVGPSVGVDSAWTLYRTSKSSFNLLGNIAAALLVGHWNFSDTYSNNAPVNIDVRVTSVNGLSPAVTGLLGIEWAQHLAAADIGVRLGYEGQVWFNQLQFYSLDLGRTNHLLSVQGGDLELRVSF